MFAKKLRNLALTATMAASIGIATSAPAQAATPTQHAPAATAHGARAAATTLPVHGTVNGSPFSGTLSQLHTFVQDGQLMISGILTGTGIPTSGAAFTTPLNVGQQAPAAAAAATPNTPAAAAAQSGCNVLTLNLNAIHLDLLGLVVDLAPVNLNITAQPGSGNLVGNLLCAVTHLLDGTGTGGGLSGLSNLLNNLLGALGL